MYKILLVKSKVTLVTLLRACQEAALPECAIPHTKTSLRCQIAVLPKPHEVKASAADSHLGSPGGTVFGYKAAWCICTVTVVPLCGHFVPKVGPKTPQGAQKVPKRSPKALL